MIAYDGSLTIKASLSSKMFPGVLRTMGTERLMQYAEDAENGIITGCFALTEVSHGSNALGMRTTATYDVKNRQFIMHSPDFEAAKCWVGNLGIINLSKTETRYFLAITSTNCPENHR